MSAQSPGREMRAQQGAQERLEACHYLPAGRNVACLIRPTAVATDQDPDSRFATDRRHPGARIDCAFPATRLDAAAMRLISLLNHYQHFPGFVYETGAALRRDANHRDHGAAAARLETVVLGLP